MNDDEYMKKRCSGGDFICKDKEGFGLLIDTGDSGCLGYIYKNQLLSYLWKKVGGLIELSKMKHFEIDGISFWVGNGKDEYAIDMSKNRVEIVSMKNFGRLPKTHWEEDSIRHYISIRVTGYLLNDTWRKENGLPALYEKTTIRQRIASVKRFLFRK